MYLYVGLFVYKYENNDKGRGGLVGEETGVKYGKGRSEERGGRKGIIYIFR